MAQAHYRTETSVLHAIASDLLCRWIWTRHAPEQMRDRGITAADVQYALTIGHVELIERKKDDVWRVKSKDLDGNPLGVACVVYEGSIAIKIVTAF